MAIPRIRARTAPDPGAPIPTLHIEGAVDGVGGSFHSLVGLLERLDRSRFEPTVLFARPCGMESRLHEHDLPCYVLPVPPIRPLAATRGAFHSQLALATIECAALIRSLEHQHGHRFAVIHTNDQLVTNAGWICAARMLRRPVVCHERQHGNFRRVHGLLASGLAAHVRISQSVERHCREHGIDCERSMVIHNGVRVPDAEQRGAAAARGRRVFARFGLDRAMPVVLCPATMAPWKGADVVVRALVALRDAGIEVPALVLAGGASDDARDWPARVAELAATLGIAEHVHWLGHRDDVTDCMAAASVVVHAARRPEPFGRVPLEAMAWGAPIVATQGGALGEVLGPEHPGLIPPEDPAAMAGAIALNLEGGPGVRELVGRGVARAASRFSIEAHVRTMEGVLAGAAGAWVPDREHGGSPVSIGSRGASC